MKKVAFISNLVPLNNTLLEVHNQEYIKHCAMGNTGNYVFHNAIQKIFLPYMCAINSFNSCYEIEADFFLTCDFVWITENHAPPYHYFVWLDNLKKNNKMLIPLSVGLQSFFYKPDFKLHPDTVRLFCEISEAVSLPCRGAYTAEILEKNGVKNTIVLGCPSIFTTLNHSFQIIQPDFLDQNAVISLNITPAIHNRAPAESFSAFYKYFSNTNFNIIGQSQNELQNTINLLPKLNIDIDSTKEKLISRYRYFYNCKDWAAEMANIDFTLGTRFHGNVMSILCGKPALFLKIDSRTDELCNFLNLPSIEFVFLKEKGINIETLYNLTDYSKFNSQYSILLKKFTNYFQKLGVFINSYDENYNTF